MVRQRINCNAPLFSPADYDIIMQRENERPRKKVLEELMHKYNTSMKRIYQIWRGEEANRIAWNQPIADISAGSGRVVSDGSTIMPSAKIEGGGVAPASTETDDTINHAPSNDNISRMGSELEKVLKEMDDIGNSIP
ncbi:hypothetical protein C1645_836320 [Glomus cerebriforme]|uniref:Uncharacterized protein n=1 Tax=Glomus cerebriforme TaxID=658196 RepID=A0A397S773_9GLOM|nr:hypothetical protein C1645_836320 [Glomus cerebriforme]